MSNTDLGYRLGCGEFNRLPQHGLYDLMLKADRLRDGVIDTVPDIERVNALLVPREGESDATNEILIAQALHVQIALGKALQPFGQWTVFYTINLICLDIRRGKCRKCPLCTPVFSKLRPDLLQPILAFLLECGWIQQ